MLKLIVQVRMTAPTSQRHRNHHQSSGHSPIKSRYSLTKPIISEKQQEVFNSERDLIRSQFNTTTNVFKFNNNERMFSKKNTVPETVGLAFFRDYQNVNTVYTHVTRSRVVSH